MLRWAMAGLGHEPFLEGPSEDRLPHLLEAAQETRAAGERASKPLAEGERLDPNRADSLDLLRLPGVGPSLAAAWLRHREREGGYRNPEDLLKVTGIGPATLEKIRPHLDFTQGVPLGLRAGPRPVTGGLDLNRATREELESLPGIGPALAARILESRAREGPYGSPEDLIRVSGIGPATLQRLEGLIRVGR